MTLADVCLLGAFAVLAILAVTFYIKKSINLWELLAIVAAMLSVLAGSGLMAGYEYYKPIPVALLVISVLWRQPNAQQAKRQSEKRFNRILAIGLIFSLLGDIALSKLGGEIFVLGLAFFLVAHCFYFAVFKRNVAWFPNRWLLVAWLLVGVVIYVNLWSGIRNSQVMVVAVAVYVLALALMVSQATGRAWSKGKTRYLSSQLAACGAMLFVLADGILAFGTFVSHFSWVTTGNLIPYYAAQVLIAHCTRFEE